MLKDYMAVSVKPWALEKESGAPRTRFEVDTRHPDKSFLAVSINWEGSLKRRLGLLEIGLGLI